LLCFLFADTTNDFSAEEEKLIWSDSNHGTQTTVQSLLLKANLPTSLLFPQEWVIVVVVWTGLGWHFLLTSIRFKQKWDANAHTHGR
jgi:hypothetical protein